MGEIIIGKGLDRMINVALELQKRISYLERENAYLKELLKSYTDKHGT